MKFDLTAAMGAVETMVPWELVLTIDGRDYPTRRPTVGEIGQLEAVKGMANRDGLAAVSAVIFAEPRPDLNAWSVEVITAALMAYLTYFNDRAEKNSLPIASAVRTTMGKALKTEA